MAGRRRHALTFSCMQPETDPSRLAVWGSSYSGGHVLVVGAVDRRVKAVVAQVPLVDGYDNFRELVRSDFRQGFYDMFTQDRLDRMAGKDPVVIPVVAEDPMAPSALPTPDSYSWFTRTAAERAPSWRNEVTLRSMDLFREYSPRSYIGRISPTPLLMVVAAADHLTPAALSLAAYGEAAEPKQLGLLPGGHFDAYGADGDFAVASSLARDFLVKHLLG